MDIQIAKNKASIPVNPARGPHFQELHPGSRVETEAGEETYQLPLDVLADTLQTLEEPAYTAVLDIAANAGLALEAGQFRAHADHSIARNGLGEEFVKLPLQDIINLLVHHSKRGQTIQQAAILQFMQTLGLEANLTRILADFCPTCGK